MIAMFRGLLDRMKALVITTLALDFEAQFAAGQAERKADRLRQANEYERQGLRSVAQDLRQHAEGLSVQRPLATITPAIEHLQTDAGRPMIAHEVASLPAPITKKKGGRA
jgi:hypothetical protein